MKKILIGFYVLLLLSATFISYLFVDANLNYLKYLYSGIAFKNRQLVTFFYILIIFSFFILYFLFLRLIHKKLINVKDLKLLVILTAGVLFFAYPAMFSYDIFNYIATSKVLFFYHENPYIIMPIEFTNDPLLSFTHAANKIALYGPSWILLTAIPHFVGFNNFILTLFSFKLFIVLFYLASVFLIWKISRNVISVHLFALNPLVIMETLISSHNDIVMIFFVLLSFYLLMKGQAKSPILFFLLSVFVKYTTVILLPVFLFIIFLRVKKVSISWKKVYYYSAWVMLFGFLLSPIREEIYPWYAIWFLVFTCLIPNRRLILYISLAFSFGLLLRYVPFMLTGTHADRTPLIKSIVTFLPPFVAICLYLIKEKVWLRIFSR